MMEDWPLIPDVVRRYAKTLLELEYTHKELSKLELELALDGGQGTKAERIGRMVDVISDERFLDLATHLLKRPRNWLGELLPLTKYQEAFIKGLRIHGFSVQEDVNQNQYIVKLLPSGAAQDRLRLSVKTFLEEHGLGQVQKSLDAAEAQFINANYSGALMMARKAIDDLLILSGKTNQKRSEFLEARIPSDSSRKLIEAIHDFDCKGHLPDVAEREAVFGYYLTLSAINYMISMLTRQKLTEAS